MTTAPPAPKTAVVLGTGLIGTSVALALREAGTEVWLSDTDQGNARLAADLGAGRLLPPGERLPEPADVVVLAMPPAAVAPCLAEAQRRGLARCYTDVASVKQLPLRAAAELGCDLSAYVPGHPMSGRERSGPAAARADLFAGRPWIICPASQTSSESVDIVTGLIAACGGVLSVMPAAEHDRCVALVSHVPHLLAVSMAARCAEADPQTLALAGQGLRDVVRIAASDAGLWTEILTANAVPAREILLAVAERLTSAADVLADLSGGNEDSVKRLTTLLEAGREGVAKIPGKHGGVAPDYAVVQAVLGDQPGELARLFAAAGVAGVNIEDVRIEHSPGLPVGVIELFVRPEAAAPLSSALAAGGWPVASPP
ncbi:MAG TPA: prephenate dehydrogenase [Streptosporangiaceae bacterium]|nr:prephenate dehydrogenase [Streptosporangiaceae bacterium]